jgi:hypothetical protein
MPVTSSTTTIPVAPAASIWLRSVLVVIAGVETALALGDFPVAFNLHNEPLSPAQFLINARLALHPLFAITATALAVRGRLRAAIVALAVYVVALWFSELPSLIHYGVEWNWSPIGLSVLGQQIVFPLMAIAAVALAYYDKHLWLAAVFVALPPLNYIVGVVIFTVAIMLYGF